MLAGKPQLVARRAIGRVSKDRWLKISQPTSMRAERTTPGSGTGTIWEMPPLEDHEPLPMKPLVMLLPL